MATTPTKTVQTAPIAWQQVASAAQVISSAVDVSTVWAAEFFIRLGRRTGSAFTAGWPNVRIEGSSETSGNNTWIPLYQYQMQVGASIANTTINGAVSANAATFVVTAATNIAVGDVLYLEDTSTSNYEIVRVKAVSGTTITPEDNVVNAHANSAVVTDQAEEQPCQIDLSTVKRIRVVIDNSGSGQGISAEVKMTTFDSF